MAVYSNQEIVERIAQARDSGWDELILSGRNVQDRDLLNLLYEPDIDKLQNLRLENNQLSMLPREIGRLTSLKRLWLTSNLLETLPSEIGQLSELRMLAAHANRLSMLPPEIGQLRSLEILWVHENQLINLSPEIGNLTSLEELAVGKNRFCSMPREFGQLIHLKTLIADDNQLSSLPPEIGNLKNLTFLVLADNRLSSLPPEIGKLTSLNTLFLNNNQLSCLPSEIDQLASLEYLDISQNQLSTLPAELGNMAALGELVLDNNRLAEFPQEVEKLTSLWRLRLDGNQFSTIPEGITRLVGLKELFLSKNQLSRLQPEIGLLIELTVLKMDNNLLSELPQEMGKLSKLKLLHLEQNQLIDLPLEFGQLTSLVNLYLSKNRLSKIPPELGQLNLLTVLDLAENQLHSLPHELGNIADLGELCVSGNFLSSEIMRLADEGKLIAYLHELAANCATSSQCFNEAKLLLIGPGQVGKTWLLQALQGKIPEATKSTRGIEISREPLSVPHPSEEKRIIHFNCWDFGGQDHFQVTHQIFFSPKAIYLLVWKPRPGVDPDLFARLERIELSAGRTAKIFIVSTHADEDVPAIIGEQAIRERFGDLIGGFFKVDSAKGPNGTGIAILKEAIAGVAAGLEGMDTLFPVSWHEASIAIRKMNSAAIPFSQFAEVCNTCKMNSESAESLAMVMDIQGHVVYFSDAAVGGEAGVTVAENLVVLNPEWLGKAVAMVIEDGPTLERSGVLEHYRLPEIWKEEARADAGSETGLCGYLLWLMWKFDIAYRINEQTSLVPELIQRNRPDDLRWIPSMSTPERQATLIGRIPHNPPLGLVAVFTAAVHPLRRIRNAIELSDDPWDRNWRNGFFLDSARRGTAFVELDDRDLRMTVRDRYPAHLLDQLRKTLDGAIKDRWPNLNIDYRIPCLSVVNNKQCSGTFRLSSLETRKGKTQHCEQCEREDIQVDHLLQGYGENEQTVMDLLRQIRDSQQDHMALTQEHMTLTKDHMALAWKLYHDVLDPARDEFRRAPCMVSILPDQGQSWNLLGKAIKNYYRVTCWCEHPDGPHPGAPIDSDTPPDYRIEMPREWVVKAAPYVSWFVTLAKAFVPVAGKMVDAAMGSQTDAMLKKNLDLMGEMGKALPSGKLELEYRYDLETGSHYGSRPEIVALRHIHDVLLEHVPKNRQWGDLRPVHTRAHGLLWLCKEHAAIQDPPVQQIV